MRIALVGLPALQAYGFESYIAKYFPGHEVMLADEANYRREWQIADRFIVSANALAAFAGFFMPRLSEVLLLTMSPSISGKEVLPILSPLADKTTLHEALTILLHRRPEHVAHANIPQEHKSHCSSTPETLTNREMDVLKLTVQGFSAKEMAKELGISVNTVLTHRKNITDKLGVHGAPALVYYAMTHGLV